VTFDSYDKEFNGGSLGGDAFVSKFDSDLTNLLSSTFLGGNEVEWRISLFINDNDDLYVCGETYSSNFPTTNSAFDQSFNGNSDIFVSLLSNDLTSLSASTFLGNSMFEEPLTIKVNNDGDVFIAGYTMSSNFPTTPGVFDTSYNGGGRDAYIAKFNSDLSSLSASTFLGGNDRDDCRAMSIDSMGNIFVTGNTMSSDFPVTSDVYDGTYGGGSPHGDAFISLFNDDLTMLSASTFLGGSSDDSGHFMTLDENGNVFVCGFTASSDFPITSSSYDDSFNGGGDCFIVKIDSDLSEGDACPIRPSIPNGPTGGKIVEEYTYSTSTTDPNGDQIYYLFDWGDDTDSGWLGPYNSGEEIEASHIWTEKGSFEIKVKAKDIHGSESDWSDPLSVSMPRYRTSLDINLQRIFDLFTRWFSISTFFD